MSKACRIGIRREDKNPWERRAPLTPGEVGSLIRDEGLSFAVQPSERRCFPDEAYRAQGAEVCEDLSGCGVVLGVKEMPRSFFREGGTYVFFSHTIKGQPYNMDMLRALLEKKCQLIDYERIMDEKGRRLIFFGRHAGLAGMIDTLWALGRRLAVEALAPNPFEALEPTWKYESLAAAKEAVRRAGRRLGEHGLPAELVPLVVGFAGYGNVSRGAQEIYDLLPVEEIAPGALAAFVEEGRGDPRKVYKTVFKEAHMVAPRERTDGFDLQDYYGHPERYASCFERYLPYLTVIMNCIYWDASYPRFITKAALKGLFGGAKRPRLRVIGDVSCDIEGAVECTVKATDPGNPVYLYEPASDRVHDGVEGTGPVILAVDNLPCELPMEASRSFSRALAPFVGPLARADFARPFPEAPLPEEIRRAVIVYHGAFTPDYRFMEKFLR